MYNYVTNIAEMFHPGQNITLAVDADKIQVIFHYNEHNAGFVIYKNGYYETFNFGIFSQEYSNKIIEVLNNTSNLIIENIIEEPLMKYKKR